MSEQLGLKLEETAIAELEKSTPIAYIKAGLMFASVLLLFSLMLYVVSLVPSSVHEAMNNQ